MKPLIQFEKKDNYLLIHGEGERKGLLTLQESSRKMYTSIVETKSRLVLIDYRKVNFDISNTDVFNTIRFYETKLPLLTSIAVAVVFNKDNQALGKTWTDVGTARGFNFKVFSEVAEAESWLLKQ